MTATDKAAEIVADVAEEVSDQALNVAEAARDAPGRGLGLAFGALFLGAGIGGGLAYLLARRRLEVKYNQIAEDEIAGMRQHYQAKITAAEATAVKLEPVKKIVAERGYAAPSDEGPPMAVQPPAVAEIEEEPSEPEPVVHNVFRDAKVKDEWDYHEERRKRSPDVPYVIHYDERHEIDGYSEVTLTYYEGDDVLCNERDDVVDPDERDRLVGEENLSKFGHGSNDAVIVFVRNDALEIVYEIVKSPNSYAEEVHGFTHGSFDRGNLERMRARERDDDED